MIRLVLGGARRRAKRAACLPDCEGFLRVAVATAIHTSPLPQACIAAALLVYLQGATWLTRLTLACEPCAVTLTACLALSGCA